MVALHPEGVDRNLAEAARICNGAVALHPEGVDRNTEAMNAMVNSSGRPPPGGRG